ncbi:thiol reductant ABC exporter subunit CydD [Solicola gregarius]|uniref:Thiol reductant ABC exporter subunit CydD n=1 Tax=Solicola gregarius TaxID=2908642 RepID=A0AA46TFX2_9ACTN|nr:thiol reductant ABC exporter subunit CydD [Solicola gregarius]UYM04371.1 thiol reductant ABC exporter subunit CydD [Solicola gregarius]
MKPAGGALDPELVRRSAPVRRHLAVAVALGTVAAGLIVAQAWLMSVAVAQGFDGDGWSGALAAAVLGVAACFAGRALIGWGHRVAAVRAASAVKSGLRREVVEALLSDRSRPAYESGHVIALLGHGLDSLDAYFSKYLPQLVLALTVPATVCAAMLWADVLAAVTVMVTLPLIVVFMVLVGWLTRDRTERRWEALKRLTHHFADVLDGLTVLKVFGRSTRQADGLRTTGEQHRVETMRALRLAFLSSFVLELCATISVALVAVGVGLRVLDGALSLQTALFVLLLAPEAFLPVRQVGAHFHDSAEGATAARDAFTLLDGVPGGGRPNLGSMWHRSNRSQPMPHRPQSGPHLDLRGIGVRYPDRDSDALPPTDLTVEPGEVVALVGPSGCGKSTMLGVLLGFVRAESGEIVVDGVPVPDPSRLRGRIAWVPQHPALIAGTVADNVRLTTAATDVDVRHALDDAAACTLALDREVTERGANLSAGERRRVAIARALLRVRNGADILLLDEPTAGLDADAERTVIEAIRREHVTTLMVAHRPALIGAADRVEHVGRTVVRV